jgi:hypothetical protein
MSHLLWYILQALVLASSVQMAHNALGNTPAIITPPFISPAGPSEPGATPMQAGLPSAELR